MKTLIAALAITIALAAPSHALVVRGSTVTVITGVACKTLDNAKEFTRLLDGKDTKGASSFYLGHLEDCSIVEGKKGIAVDFADPFLVCVTLQGEASCRWLSRALVR
jgi:hypothetical protein